MPCSILHHLGILGSFSIIILSINIMYHYCFFVQLSVRSLFVLIVFFFNFGVQ